MSHHSYSESFEADYRGQNLAKFPPYDYLGEYTSLFFQNNKISSFKSLPSISGLRKLFLDSNNIKSFKHAQPQPNLRVISLSNNPISSEEYLGLMSYIVFGDNVSTVNHISLSTEEKNLGRKLRPHVINDLLNEWVIRSINPIILVDMNSLFEKRVDISSLNNSHRKHTPKSSRNKKSIKKEDIEHIEIKKTPVLEIHSKDDDISLYLKLKKEIMEKNTHAKRSSSHHGDPALKLDNFEFNSRKTQSPVSKYPQLKIFETIPEKQSRTTKNKLEKPKFKIKHSNNNQNDVQLTELPLVVQNEELKTLSFQDFKINKNTSEPMQTEDNFTLITNITIQDDGFKQHHVPPPKLNLTPIVLKDSEDPDITLTSDLSTEELADLFYRSHMNEITTPEDLREFVKTQKKLIRQRHLKHA